MIDIHSHILPGVDDGSKSFQESKKMLLEAKEAGFDIVISTSHYADGCYEADEAQRLELFNELKKDRTLPRLVLGSEIFINYNIIDILNDHKASVINNTNYVLVELPISYAFPNAKDVINNLKEHNYRVILAHPERYFAVHENFDLLYELRDMGVLFQCNYASILGYYGPKAKKTVKKILKLKLATFLGSDVHKSNTIYEWMPDIFRKISKICSVEYIDDLTTNNPLTMLRNEKFM